MGAWACRTCAQTFGLEDGYSTSAYGYCAPGRHDVKGEEIRWYEDAWLGDLQIQTQKLHEPLRADEPRGLSVAEAPCAESVTPDGQMDMFGPNHEPLRGGA